jgi:SAM-dependent methyltransferase
MKPVLLDVLACPSCRGAFALESPIVESGEVIRGALRCTSCAMEFAIADGVPRLIASPDEVRRTKEGFEYQWGGRLRGRHERRTYCYGFPTREFVGWLMAEYGAALDGGGDRWILDAGCGSAEKAAELATRYPRAQVVGLDLSDTLAVSQRENAALDNLHFVQGDVHHPPFKPRAIDYIMSIGVLHHTCDTRRAFDAIAELVKPGGGMLLFIYPAAGEDRFWTALYRQRDGLFRGRAHDLPRPVLMGLCHLYMALTFLPAWVAVRRHARDRRAEFPFTPARQGLRDFYRAGVFLSFDNLMPPYQHRHARDEVVGWYRARGFAAVDARFPGFAFGRRAELA